MIGFGAGAGQMSAIFGLQTRSNEPPGVESGLARRNRETVVGLPSCEIFQHLPGIRNMRADGRSPASFQDPPPPPLTISYGEIVHKMRPHTVSVGELQVGMCFLWLSGACAPNFGPHTKFAARCITSLCQRGEADAFLPLRCLNIYPNCSRFLHYVHICHLR